MLRRLKFRFILLAMISMTATLIIAFTAVSITLRAQMSKNTDSIIETLYENGGQFSLFRHADEDSGYKPFMHSETPFRTRYYVAYLDSAGNLYKADFAHIAMTNIDLIKEQTASIYSAKKTKGYIGNYRYGVYSLEDGIMIIGIDCTEDLQTINMLNMITLITIAFCIVIVLILLLVFSNRVLRPFEENREKQRQFITDAGHELKTPIAIIRSNTEVLEMTEGESKWLTNIKQQTERMSRLVKGLVELSKMDEQTLSEKEKQRIVFSEIVSNSAESFRVPAESKGIELNVGIAPDVFISGDLEDIVRLTGILIDNAVKYTDSRKQINISLSSKAKKAVLKVSNTCAGIDRSSVPKFFDRFYRSDESRSSETGGYGIGLSMAQTIVRNHKGKISVSYSEDEIITFTVELPSA